MCRRDPGLQCGCANMPQSNFRFTVKGRAEPSLTGRASRVIPSLPPGVSRRTAISHHPTVSPKVACLAACADESLAWKDRIQPTRPGKQRRPRPSRLSSRPKQSVRPIPSPVSTGSKSHFSPHDTSCAPSKTTEAQDPRPEGSRPVSPKPPIPSQPMPGKVSRDGVEVCRVQWFPLSLSLKL